MDGVEKNRKSFEDGELVNGEPDGVNQKEYNDLFDIVQFFIEDYGNERVRWS